MSLAAAPVSILLGPFLPRLRRIFTPVVSGTVIMLIGLSLIPAGMHDIAMGFGPGSVPWHSLAVAIMIIAIVVGLGSLNRPVGPHVCGAPGSLGRLRHLRGARLSPGAAQWAVARLASTIAHGLSFQWQYLVPFGFLYIVSSIETVGDVTATCQLSGLPTRGDGYWSRIRGGVMADGVNSVLAACLGIFPNTTYAQNNGVIPVDRRRQPSGGLLHVRVPPAIRPRSLLRARSGDHAAAGAGRSFHRAFRIRRGRGRPDPLL